MDKHTHAAINNQECHIGDFVIVGVGRFEHIYRVAGVKFDADGCFLSCVTDSQFTSCVKISSEVVVGVLLESEVKLDKQWRFCRAD